MENKNEITITFDSYSVNEGFARMAAAAFDGIQSNLR